MRSELPQLNRALIRVGQSSVTANHTGWLATIGGEVAGYGNNVAGNATDGALPRTVTLK